MCDHRKPIRTSVPVQEVIPIYGPNARKYAEDHITAEVIVDIDLPALLKHYALCAAYNLGKKARGKFVKAVRVAGGVMRVEVKGVNRG